MLFKIERDNKYDIYRNGNARGQIFQTRSDDKDSKQNYTLKSKLCNPNNIFAGNWSLGDRIPSSNNHGCLPSEYLSIIRKYVCYGYQKSILVRNDCITLPIDILLMLYKRLHRSQESSIAIIGDSLSVVLYCSAFCAMHQHNRNNALDPVNVQLLRENVLSPDVPCADNCKDTMFIHKVIKTWKEEFWCRGCDKKGLPLKTKATNRSTLVDLIKKNMLTTLGDLSHVRVLII